MADESSPSSKPAAAASNPQLHALACLVLALLRAARGVVVLAGFALASFAAIPLTLLFLAGCHLSQLLLRKAL